MADQGASQRRGSTNSLNSTTGQGSTLFPKSSSSETLPVLSFGAPSGHEEGPSEYRGYYDVNITHVNTGGLFEDPSGQASRSQRQTTLLLFGSHDLPSQSGDRKQDLHTPTGVTSPNIIESPNMATSEEGAAFASPSQLQQPAQVFYKLVAYDSVTTTTATRWVSNVVSLANAPASNGPGVLVLATLAVEASWTQ